MRHHCAVTSLAMLMAAAMIAGCDRGELDARSKPGATAALEATPIARFGGIEEQPLHQVTDAVLVGDTLVLAENSTGTLRYYELEAGRELQVVGGEGEGPGEFQDLSWLQKEGGSLFAYDSDQRRVSEFSLDGRFVGSVVLEPSEDYGYLRVEGVFADGSMLVEALRWVARPAAETVYRRDFALLRFDSGGGFADSLGPYEGTEMYVEPMGNGGRFYMERLFGRESAVATSGSRYFVVENDDYGIAVYDTSGARIDRLSPEAELSARAVTGTDVEEARARLVEASTERIEYGPIVDRMPLPDSVPPYGWDGEREMRLLTVTETGEVWVLNHGGVRDSTPLWTVYGADGRVRGHVPGPADFDVLTASGDRVVLKRWSPQDVESVEVREIQW